MKKRYLLSAIALAASTLLMPVVASAQDFPPKRPVTLFVGFAPGGAADAAARLIAKKLTENIGQNVIVENKAGAGGNIVHQQVANGVADGSEQVAFFHESTVIMGLIVNSKLRRL